MNQNLCFINPTQTSYSGRPFSPQLQRPGSRGGVLLAAGSPVPTVESPVTSSAPPSLAVTQAMTALCLDDRLQIQEVDQGPHKNENKD